MHNIIIEGADGTGKSTLANFLAPRLRMEIKESEGPTKDVDDFLERADRYARLENTIIVRHPHISEMIYGKVRGTYDTYFSHPAFLTSLNDFLGSPPLIIYCRQPPLDMPHHLKPHDTSDHIKMIEDKKETIARLYSEWERDCDLHYQIGFNTYTLLNNLSRIRFDPIGDIRQFHEKFGLEYKDIPRTIPKPLSDFRINFLKEELEEYIHATYVAENDTEALYDCLDALIDLTYIACGTSYLHGFNHLDIFAEAWRRVHRANMHKVRSPLRYEHDGRGSSFDVVKPPGWVAPSFKDLF